MKSALCLLGLLGSLPVSGCFDPSITENLACAADMSCPPGQSCVSGFCMGSDDGEAAESRFHPASHVDLDDDPTDLLHLRSSASSTDLIVSTRNSNESLLLLQGGAAGGFAVSPLPLEGQSSGGSLRVGALADINQDDGPELVQLHDDAPASVSLALSLGQDSYSPREPLLLDALGKARDLLVVDVDNDGTEDLVACGDEACLFLQGSGTQGAPFADPLQVGTRPASLVVAADLDGDEHLDLALVGSEGGVQVLLQDPDTSASFPASAILIANESVRDLLVEDFDGDERPDLLMLTDARVYAVFGRDALQSEPSVLAIEGGQAFASADFDLDGALDLAIVGGGLNAGSFGRLLLREGESFATSTPFQVGDRPIDIIARDFDFDGRPDVAVLNIRSRDLSVSLSR